MAFYAIEEDGQFLTWKLTGGNARFHFFLFKFYSIFLIVLGIFCGVILLQEEPESYLWLAGVLPIIPGFIMFFTRYPLMIQFGPEEVRSYTKNVFKGMQMRSYPIRDLDSVQWEYIPGKFGGFQIHLLLKSGEVIKLAKIPWLRLKKENAIRDLERLAAHSGLSAIETIY